jgi:hypothetical protein
VHFLPWWALLACLAASAVAAYLLLERTQAGDSPRALFPLTVLLAPVVLAGAMAAAVVLSTLLFAPLDDRAAGSAGPPDPPARAERTGGEATAEGTELEATLGRSTAPATGGPSSSPGASPGASPAASSSASASP